jgi:hypothetical protein
MYLRYQEETLHKFEPKGTVMWVKFNANRIEKLSKEILKLAQFDQNIFSHLQNDHVFIIYAMASRLGYIWFYVHVKEYDTCPIWIPASLFNVVVGKISKHWIYHAYSFDNLPEYFAIWGFPEWVQEYSRDYESFMHSSLFELIWTYPEPTDTYLRVYDQHLEHMEIFGPTLDDYKKGNLGPLNKDQNEYFESNLRNDEYWRYTYPIIMKKREIFDKYSPLINCEFPHPHITLAAEALDDTWLYCPSCIDAWESTSEEGMVMCPLCQNWLRNPRYKSR